ncbi:MAG: riboflavin synthase [Chloroflexota bacterium]|nr:riboflavin synthase [Chloroflexota bacterium]
MFTGIVEEIGTVERLEVGQRPYLLTIAAKMVLNDVELGDSINVNGVCLTVTQLTSRTFTVGLMPETLRRSNLGDLHPGDGVNLERALAPQGRLGGHFVQGHVDGVGRIAAQRPELDALWITISAPPQVMRYLVPKAYIAVDGVSLTVVEVMDSAFSVSLVAYTQTHITLPRKQVGDRVNLEVDILAKYVDRLLHREDEGLTLEFLAQHGFVG